ncbi:endonuclease I family protein [Bacillus sp. FSL K6-3431]|uniref:endonuclease I family protein n=1 Tax=Bacillus sp. FSL K6-3431 TaxID=2921500 RepID=UPI0030F57EDA
MYKNRLESILASLEIYRSKIINNELVYYDEEANMKDTQRYYHRFKFQLPSSRKKFFQLHTIVRNSHKNILPYFISKDEYLYTWVDLQPNGIVKNIYSGEEMKPADLIKQDFEVQIRHVDYERLQPKENTTELISIDLKFNAEHIVPQSWFSGREPMKGDLHHLFACDPQCNAIRSNFEYHDFVNYSPESPNENIRNHCGVASFELFEPEYGKGTIARAMLYFILRYPDGIRKSFRKKVDFTLLRKWNQQFPPSIYEKHRNQAIFHIQGNRNPFIDYPELIDEFYFPL